MVDGGRIGAYGRGFGAAAALALAAGDARNLTRCLALLAPLSDLRHHSELCFNIVLIFLTSHRIPYITG